MKYLFSLVKDHINFWLLLPATVLLSILAGMIAVDLNHYIPNYAEGLPKILLRPKTTITLLLLWLATLTLYILFYCSCSKKPTKTYEIYCRFKGLVNTIKQHDIKDPKFPVTRSKPWFSNYNSCIKEFKKLYKREFQELNLEPLPVYGEKGEHLFTNDKRQTLLHQSEQIKDFLEGKLPPEYKKTI